MPLRLSLDQFSNNFCSISSVMTGMKAKHPHSRLPHMHRSFKSSRHTPYVKPLQKQRDADTIRGHCIARPQKTQTGKGPKRGGWEHWLKAEDFSDKMQVLIAAYSVSFDAYNPFFSLALLAYAPCDIRSLRRTLLLDICFLRHTLLPT